MIRKFVLSAILIVVLTANVPTTHAAGVVTNCSNDTDFSNKLAGGGLVTFNCGGVNASATIILSSPKTIFSAMTVFARQTRSHLIGLLLQQPSEPGPDILLSVIS